MWGPLSRRGWELWLSLGSPQGIQTSLHPVRWKMTLHLRHCREIQPSFESGPFRFHFTWGRKHRVALTYLFLSEGYSWGACGKLGYLFSRRQGIILIPRWYGLHGSFLNLLYWNWWSSVLEMVFSANLSSFLKGVKPLVLYDEDRVMVMEPMQGNWPHLNLIWGKTIDFAFLRWHQCSSRLVTVLLGTL